MALGAMLDNVLKTKKSPEGDFLFIYSSKLYSKSTSKGNNCLCKEKALFC